jgi:hypothetical protein
LTRKEAGYTVRPTSPLMGFVLGARGAGGE